MWTIETWRERLPNPVLGMVHLRPLPGSPGWDGDWPALETAALADARALAAGGVGALMIENFGDVPFEKDRVAPVTVAAMSRLVTAVRGACPDLPCGVNVLRNDARAALGVAVAAGADFIRVNVLAGAVLADQGLIEGSAASLMRERAALAADVGVLADLRVKHAAPLAERPLTDEAADLRLRAGADALVLSGAATGAPADPEPLRRLRAAMPDCPLAIGSGLNAANVADFVVADLFIVGSSLKSPGPDGRPAVDPDRVTAFVEALAAARAAASSKESR